MFRELLRALYGKFNNLTHGNDNNYNTFHRKKNVFSFFTAWQTFSALRRNVFRTLPMSERGPLKRFWDDLYVEGIPYKTLSELPP